ncbi:MAG: GTP 3',8-cyclase MoaA [Actinomycetes bacterium]
MDDRPPPTPLVDGFGRVHRDLRISVTDRCNFRCDYCMPAEGMDWLPRHELLTFEEITRVARLLVERFGITSVRLTGGEPTVRARLPVLVSSLAGLGVDLSLTTNGATLAGLADDLAAAGLGRVNVSLDSLRADRFLQLTRRDALDDVLAGIRAAVAAGLSPVKVNMVPVRGINDDEIAEFVEFGRRHGVEVRFIEFMPLDAQGEWRADRVVPRSEVLASVAARFAFAPTGRGQEPAERFELLDGSASFGVVPSVTAPFCGDCDRVRLTSDGMLRNCLFATDDHDLRPLLRGGGSDDELAAAVAACVSAKREGHGIGAPTFVRPPRPMSRIGG